MIWATRNCNSSNGVTVEKLYAYLLLPWVLLIVKRSILLSSW